MASLQLPVLAALSLLSGPAMFVSGFRDLRKRRLIRDTPTARIRSMAMGLVEVNGVVAMRSTVEAPFSGRACAYWQVDIATRTRQKAWSIVHRNGSGQPFHLRDETGLALVYPKGAECRVNFGLEEECLGINVPDVYTKYMSDQGLMMRHLWRLSTLRFRERIIEEGQQVYLLGSAEPRSLVHDVSQEDAFAATGTDDYRTQRLRAANDQLCGVIRRGRNEPTFIISQQPERELEVRLGLSAFGKVAGGPALTLFGLAYWLSQLAR